MDKQPVGQLPDLTQSNNDDEIMVITNDEYNQLKKEKISDFITDLTSTDENNAIVKGTDGKLFTKDFGNASNITEGTLPVSVLPDIPKDKLPEIETDDLPDSGITAGTYTYPTDIVVNSKGQVTSITEGQTGANNANQDLSNLGPLGLDKLNQSKALETGSVSSDADVYADVLERAHSTFDKSKFEVVGSPTISEDGILTSTSLNYVYFTGLNLYNASSWKIKGSFIATQVDNTIKVILSIANNINGFGIQFYLNSQNFYVFQGSSNSTSWLWTNNINSSDFQNNTKYYYVIEFTGTKYNLNISTDDIEYTTISSYTTSDKISALTSTMTYNIGSSKDANRAWDKPIDLKDYAVWSDGQLVFNGNKTGTDTFGEIEIPYTLSNTGSKIVDAAYRDRVQDVYEQYGTAMYYTIDEENQNFTLPMGDIYGMITKNREILDIVYPIGRPMPEENNVLLDNEVWLEGATVNIVDYPKLFKVYGTKYGGDGTTTFKLPDLRNRVLWGSSDGSNGYIEAKLPNIKGSCGKFDVYEAGGEGCFNINSQTYGNTREQWGGTVAAIGFNASTSNSIYSDDATTVQPPAFKVRWKTRFE